VASAVVGPHRYTGQDVARTLALGRTLFDLLPGGYPPDPAGPAAPHRARAEAVLDAHDAGRVAGGEALAELWAAWHAATEALRAAGTYGPPATGTVDGLFRGDGGTPKHPVGAVEVGWDGVAGDRQADRRNHGRPWQALCLWSTEVIGAFAAAGHPLAPGLAGENITVGGLPWERVVPGARLRIGAVEAEVTAYAVPCKKNAAWFLGRRFDAMHHRHGPVSRVYATVLRPGPIRVGGAAVLEPPPG
jgi:hypothetical protein